MSPELQIALEIIKKTNAELMNHFKREGLGVLKFKNGSEIVTEMDVKINDIIVEELQKNFPNHSIASEEMDFVDRGPEHVWHIDPIDGTTNFSVGFPEFGTCLGLSQNGKLTIGLIGLPFMDEILFAENGAGAICSHGTEDKKITVSNVKKLEGSFLMFCAGHGKVGRQRFSLFYNNIKDLDCRFRMVSSAGVELAAVADGRVDGCAISSIHNWDVAAGVVLIREAGGRVTNFAGEEWKLGDDNIVATNGLIHDDLLKFTKEVI